MTHQPIANLARAIVECSALPQDMLTREFAQHIADRYDEQQFAIALDRVAKAMHKWWSE